MTEAAGVRKVVLGVGGGIAAYKACHLLRLFTESGRRVRVVPTASALRFVGAATFEALSGNAVSTGVFEEIPSVQHVRIGQEADLVVIAPATADLMARAVAGRADDLLTATLLTARCPVLMAPAMHTEMWEHPATRANVATLRERGVHVMDPAEGRLTGKDTGAGRLPDPEDIATVADLLLDHPEALPHDLAGRHIVISAGGTREPLDPVRFLGNRSSGKQGVALARVARQRGARVSLVAGHVATAVFPAGVEVTRVSTALEMQAAVAALAPEADAVVMAAAVADFRPAAVSAAKIKKGAASEPDSVPLVRNPDILAGLVAARTAGDLPESMVIVGFAAETGDATAGVLDHGRVKLATKGCDLLVVNAVGEGRAFEVDENAGWLLGRDGSESSIELGSKAAMSAHILHGVARLLAPSPR